MGPSEPTQDHRPWVALGPVRSVWQGVTAGAIVLVCESRADCALAIQHGLAAVFAPGGLIDEPLPPGHVYTIVPRHDREDYDRADLWAAKRRGAGDKVDVRDWSTFLEENDIASRGGFSFDRLVELGHDPHTVFDLPPRPTAIADWRVEGDVELERARAYFSAERLRTFASDPGGPYTDEALRAAARLKLDDLPAFERMCAEMREHVDMRRWPTAVRDMVRQLVATRQKTRPGKTDEERTSVKNYEVTFELDDNGRSKAVYHHVDLPTLIDQVYEATDQWPRLVRGQLFVPGPDYGTFNGATPIHRLEGATELAAWLQRKCDVAWRDGQVEKRGERIRSVNYGELFAGLQQTTPHSYDRVESLPHYPEARRIHYTSPTPEGDGGRTLEAFLDLFNPETDFDRHLIKALLVTPGWGGGFGQRPAFVIMSDHGRGVGKTSTIMAISRVWNGHLSMDKNEDWTAFVSRLLTPQADSKRIVLVDNLKGRWNSSALEAVITAPTISGKQMYKGDAETPNSFTWCISANTPELTTDLSDRSVPIKIGPRQHDIDFTSQVVDFLRHHHETLVGDIIEFLQSPARCELEHTTRFQAWERAILSRFDEGNELVELIRSRRGFVDAEADDAADALAVIHDLLAEGGYPDPDIAHTIIPTTELVAAFRSHWMEPSISTTRLWSRLKPLLIQGAFAGQASKQDGGKCGRGLRWCGLRVPDGVPPSAWDADAHPYS